MSPEKAERLPPRRVSARSSSPALSEAATTPQGVLMRLQNTLGNHALQRLILAKRLPQIAGIQREEEEHIPLEVAPGGSGGSEIALEEGEGTIQRKLSRTRGLLVQRFTDEDVNNRARQIWEKKGSPPNQSKADQDKDYFEARQQLETEERAHGIWEEKGKPKDQTAEQQKQDYSDAEYQLLMVRELNAITAVDALQKKLDEMKKRGAAWSISRYVFKTISDAVRDMLRPSAPARTAAFALCSSAAEKAELIHYLKGDEAWKNTAMTEAGVDNNTYREALVRLGVFEKGLAPHKTGPEADALIATHLKDQVATNFEARGRITGRVAVLGGADWDVVGRAQYGANWNTKRTTLNAFVDRTSDPPRVFVNKDRGNAGTAIHEAVHMWGSSARPINAESHNLNEGVTEYFARKVCGALTPPIARTVYAKEFAIASKMVGVVNEEPVARAFFDGQLDVLKNAFLHLPRWTRFTAKVEASDYTEAGKILDTLAQKKASRESLGESDLGGLFDNMA